MNDSLVLSHLQLTAYREMLWKEQGIRRKRKQHECILKYSTYLHTVHACIKKVSSLVAINTCLNIKVRIRY